MKNLQKKQWVKVALMSAPVVALVIANLFGLGAEAQTGLEEVITTVVTIVAGALGVTGVAMNNDKAE